MLASEVFVFWAMVVMVLATTASALWMTYCAISFSLTVKLCCMATIFEMTGDTINESSFKSKMFCDKFVSYIKPYEPIKCKSILVI